MKGFDSFTSYPALSKSPTDNINFSHSMLVLPHLHQCMVQDVLQVDLRTVEGRTGASQDRSRRRSRSLPVHQGSQGRGNINKFYKNFCRINFFSSRPVSPGTRSIALNCTGMFLIIPRDPPSSPDRETSQTNANVRIIQVMFTN